MRTTSALLICLLTAATQAAVTTYPAPDGYPASTRYKVTFDNQPAHVYNAEVVAPEQRWVRHPEPLATRTVGYAMADTTGPLQVRVEVLGDTPRSVRVRPASKGITPKVDGRLITFAMAGPDNLVVELNNDPFEHLYLFVSPPETNVPKADDPNVRYFGPGVHDAGQIDVAGNDQTVYLAGGAVVNGFIRAEGVTGLTIRGRGILCGTGQARGSYLIRPRNCSRILIEGITLVDSPTWTLRMENCSDVQIRWHRQICHLQNSDGIDPYSCRNVNIRHVFLRNYDDNVVIKTELDSQPSENIVTRHGTFIADHGTALKCGFNETKGPPIRDIVFEDCDVLCSRGRPLGLLLNGPSPMANIRFENIRVEEPIANASHRHDDLPLSPVFIELLIQKGNAYLSNYTPGHIHGVVFKDITGVSRQDQLPPVVTIDGLTEASSIADVTFDNVTLDGQPIVPGHPSLHVREHAYNLRFQPAGGALQVLNPRTGPLPALVQPHKPPMPSPEPELTADGSILLQAECGQLGGRMKTWSDDPTASGGWHLVAGPRSGAQAEPPGKSAQAIYQFMIPEPRRYRFDGLVKPPTQQANSFWIKVDDGDWIAWTNLPVATEWSWVEVADSKARNAPLELELGAGEHRLFLAAREDDTPIDRLRIRPVPGK